MLRLELKAAIAATDEGVIEGFASIFGTADLGRDVVHKGAFAGARPPVPMLASHDPADVVGVWESLEETAEGLKVKGRLLVDAVARAREVLAMVKAGAMRGLSIGYVATKATKRQGGGRDLRAVDLKEISVVAVPMHPDARITAAKQANGGAGMDPEELETKLKEIETKAAGAVEAAVAAVVKPLSDRLDKIEAKAGRPSGGGGGGDDVTVERKAFRSYLVQGDLAPDVERKALSVSQDPTGGYLVPPEYASEILRDLVELSPMRRLASVRSTVSTSVIYPTRKQMRGGKWDTELDAEEETTGDPFGNTEVPIHGASTFVAVSNQLLADAPGVEAEVRAMVAEDFAIMESEAFVKGDGDGKPQGITAAAISHVKSGNASQITADALIRLIYDLPTTYRRNATFAMSSKTAAEVRLLKDGNQRYLWQDGLQAGQPDRLLGYAVEEFPDLPDVEAGAFPIYFGDFSGYRIVDRAAISILVDPYSNALNKRTLYHVGRRVGGKVLMPAKFRKLKIEA